MDDHGSITSKNKAVWASHADGVSTNIVGEIFSGMALGKFKALFIKTLGEKLSSSLHNFNDGVTKELNCTAW